MVKKKLPSEKGVCCSYLGVRVQCPKCHSWVWPQEKWVCCGDGKRVLGHRYKPPLDEGYKALLKGPHVSYKSVRYLAPFSPIAR